MLYLWSLLRMTRLKLAFSGSFADNKASQLAIYI